MASGDLAARVDVLDFLITILRDHEKTLSESIDRLEAATERLVEERRRRP